MTENDIIDKAVDEKVELLRRMMLAMTPEERRSMDLFKTIQMLLEGVFEELKRAGVK